METVKTAHFNQCQVREKCLDFSAHICRFTINSQNGIVTCNLKLLRKLVEN